MVIEWQARFKGISCRQARRMYYIQQSAENAEVNTTIVFYKRTERVAAFNDEVLRILFPPLP